MKVSLKHAIISGRNDTTCVPGGNPGSFRGRSIKKKLIIELAERFEQKRGNIYIYMCLCVHVCIFIYKYTYA